jgi:uncharacterized protein involved in exopolysaccharide biosynthesis
VKPLVWPPQRRPKPEAAHSESAAPSARTSPSTAPPTPSGRDRLERLLDQKAPAEQPPTRSAPPPAPPSAGQVLARRSWIVLLAAVVIGAATYEISRRLPARYSSSATVAVQVSGSDPNSTTQAANTMAGQFAQQVTAQGVLGAASQALHVSVSELNTSVSGGVVGDQNLITIQASAGSPQAAEQRAATVTSDFIKYVASQAVQQRQTYEKSSQQQLAPINSEIQQVTQQLNRFSQNQTTSARYLSLQSTNSTLLAERAAALASIAQDGSGGYPSMTMVSAAQPGTIVAPQPKLYAIIGFILALIIVGRLVVYFAPRGRSR